MSSMQLIMESAWTQTSGSDLAFRAHSSHLRSSRLLMQHQRTRLLDRELPGAAGKGQSEVRGEAALPSCWVLENARSLTFVSQALQEGDIVEAKNLGDLGLFCQQPQVLSGIVEQQVPPSERCRRKELKPAFFFSAPSKQVLGTKARDHKSLFQAASGPCPGRGCICQEPHHPQAPRTATRCKWRRSPDHQN